MFLDQCPRPDIIKYIIICDEKYVVLVVVQPRMPQITATCYDSSVRRYFVAVLRLSSAAPYSQLTTLWNISFRHSRCVCIEIMVHRAFVILDTKIIIILRSKGKWRQLEWHEVQYCETTNNTYCTLLLRHDERHDS